MDSDDFKCAVQRADISDKNLKTLFVLEKDDSVVITAPAPTAIHLEPNKAQSVNNSSIHSPSMQMTALCETYPTMDKADSVNEEISNSSNENTKPHSDTLQEVQ